MVLHHLAIALSHLQARIIEDLRREVTALWQTDELRRRKPTPLDEARGGLHIVEQSLWAAVPQVLRGIDQALRKHTGKDLPINAAPIRFGSWMGGDRDGNPNVTAKVTHNVACLARWIAADLYLREVDALRFELSMGHASEALWKMVRIISAKHAEQDEAQEAAIHNRYQGTGSTAGGNRGPSNSQWAGLGATKSSSKAKPQTSRILGSDEDLSGGSPTSNNSSIPLGREESFQIGPERLALLLREEAPVEGGYEGGIDGMMSPPSVGSPTAKGDWWGPIAQTNSQSTELLSSARTSVDRDMKSEDAAMPQSPGRLKQRGNQAARYHKTSIENLLHPRAAGATPYRVVLGDVRSKLVATRRRMEDLLAGFPPNEDADWYSSESEFLEPLLACYWSLWECGGGVIADGRLLDLIRRVHCFGMSLMKMDIRQESSRHTEALDEVTQFLGLGSYKEWDEETRLNWLIEELEGKRPLIPPTMPFSPEAKEVFDTMKVRI